MTTTLTVIQTEEAAEVEHTHDACGVWHPLTPRLITALAMKVYSAMFAGCFDIREGKVEGNEVIGYLIGLLADEPDDLSDDGADEWHDQMFTVVYPMLEALMDEGYLARPDEPDEDDYWPFTFPDPEGWLANWQDDAERASRALDNIAFDMLLADRLSIR